MVWATPAAAALAETDMGRALGRPGLCLQKVVFLELVTRKSMTISLAAIAGLVLAACGSSSSSSSGTSGPVKVPSITVNSFTVDFSAMTQLKALAAKGKGNVGVILPDTVTSARYTEFDAPYLTESLTAAGLSPTQFSVQNAQGSDATELTLAQEAITKGASVLIMDPLDSTVGAQIESYAKAHAVPVIDY